MESSFYNDEKNLLKFFLKANLFNEKNFVNWSRWNAWRRIERKT